MIERQQNPATQIEHSTVGFSIILPGVPVRQELAPMCVGIDGFSNGFLFEKLFNLDQSRMKTNCILPLLLPLQALRRMSDVRLSRVQSSTYNS